MKLHALITVLILIVTMFTSEAAPNLTNWFPHLASTYYGCQKAGFKESPMAFNVAQNQTMFFRTGYQFLEGVTVPNGVCSLTFNNTTKKLINVTYSYTIESPTTHTSLATLVKTLTAAFGSMTIEKEYKKQNYIWYPDGVRVRLHLDDIRDYVSISVTP